MDGGEGFAAVGPGGVGSAEGDVSQQPGGSGQQTQQSYQDTEARQAAAALYQYNQQMAQQMQQMQSQMGPLLELQQRLAGNQEAEKVPIENYDEYLTKLMESQKLLLEHYQFDQQERQRLFTEYQQQEQARYQAELSGWVENAVTQADAVCTEAGYPGFKESLPTIAAYIENEVSSRLRRGETPQSPEFQQFWREKVDHPQAWVDVFVNKVLPMYKNKIVGRYDRMGDRRLYAKVPLEEAEYKGRATIR